MAVRSRAAARDNPQAQLPARYSAADLLAAPYVADPLRAHDCAPVSDGAAVAILAAGDRARELCPRPAWITGFEHRIDSAVARRPRPDGRPVGHRRRAAGARARPASTSPNCTRPSPTRRSCCGGRSGLGEGVRVNPSGGALCGNPMFAAGLARIGLAANEMITGRADRALGHATSGPALQQNLVCVMEARS